MPASDINQATTTDAQESVVPRVPGFKQWAVFFGLVLLLGLLIYQQARHFEYINFDDFPYLKNNPWLPQGFTSASLRWAFLADLPGYFSKNAEYWSPLTLLSRLADAQVFGMNPSGFHVTSVLLHLANAMLLCFALYRLTAQWGRSAFVALLFLVHPLNVEPVCWLSARKDLVSGMFFFVTLIAYASYAQRPSRGRYFTLLLAFGSAVMSKPMVVSTPFILLVLDFWPLGRWQAGWKSKAERWRLLLEKVPLLMMAAAAAALAVFSQQDWGAIKIAESIPLWARINNALVSYVTYLRRVFWPDDLAIFYQHQGTSLPLWCGIVAATILLAISGIALWQAKRRPYLISGWLWFGIALGPVIGLVQVALQAMADRYAYPSVIGIFVIIVWLAADTLGNRPRLIGALTAASIAALGLTSMRQVTFWNDDVTAFSRAVAVTRNNEIAMYNLGSAYIHKGDWVRAHEAMARAVELNPKDSQAWTNLGLLEGLLKHDDAAIAAFQHALQTDAYDPIALLRLGLLLAQRGQNSQAEDLFVRANKADPQAKEPWIALSKLYATGNHWKEAAAVLSGYLQAHPEDKAAREEEQKAEAMAAKSP